MKRISFPFILILIYCSCSSENRVEEVKLTVTDSTAFSTANLHNDSIEIPFDSSMNYKAHAWVANYTKTYDTIQNEKGIIAEHFESTYTYKIALRKRSSVNYGNVENVFPVANLFFMTFKDTTVFQNVLNNWYGCFGSDCTPISPGENLKAIKSPPSFTIINSKRTEIIHLTYACEHQENDWNEFTKQLATVFAEKKATTISVECGGPLKWK